MRFLHFNHMVVMASALMQWCLGALWYSPWVFGKPWQAAANIRPENRERAAVFSTIASLFGSMIVSFSLLHAIVWAQVYGFKRGALLGSALWFGFVATPMAVQSVGQGKPFRLFAIDAGYWMFALILSGVLLARWQ